MHPTKVKDEYPLNLMKDVYGKANVPYKTVDEIPKEEIYKLEDICSRALGSITGKLIELYYERGYELNKVACEMNMVYDKAKKNKCEALNALRKHAKIISITKDTIKDNTPVEDIFISNGIVEKLIRNGCYTFKDLKTLSYDDIIRMRYVGIVIADKIVSRLKELGVDVK